MTNEEIIKSFKNVYIEVSVAKDYMPSLSLFTYNYEKNDVKKIYGKLIVTMKLLNDLIEKYEYPKRKKYKSVEELFHIYMKKHSTKVENGKYKIIVPHFKKYLMDNSGISVENKVEKEVLKLMDTTINVYKKRIGLPSVGDGFNFDPSNRVYFLRYYI